MLADDGCHTRACEVRVWHRKQRHVIHPFRVWLRHLRNCESHGNFRAIGGRGKFRGGYQMTFVAWRGAGGHGDPASATPLEQGYRAVRWRRIIGNPHSAAGWPICG